MTIDNRAEIYYFPLMNDNLNDSLESMLKESLNTDGLAEAEQITGKTYKESAETSALGFLLHRKNLDKKNKLLELLQDTGFTNELSDYLSILEKEGFKEIYSADFVCPGHDLNEKHFIFFNYEFGILLNFDTYDSSRVNGGHFYYNWKPKERLNWRDINCTKSGGFHSITEDKNSKNLQDFIWAGDHDCREALRFNIRQLKEQGNFVTPWKFKPFLWLLNYADSRIKDYNYEKINSERIAAFPPKVRELMGLTVGE